VELFVRGVWAQVTGYFIESPPAGLRRRRQGGATRLACCFLERRMLRPALERCKQRAISFAIETAGDHSHRLSASPFQPLQEARNRGSFDVGLFKLQGTFTQAGEQDIQIAHVPEHPGQPLELNFKPVSPVSVDEIL
jgi:hypothetical protein